MVKDLASIMKRQEDHIAKQDEIITKQNKRIAELESTVEHLQMPTGGYLDGGLARGLKNPPKWMNDH